jgi:hypothetical protein
MTRAQQDNIESMHLPGLQLQGMAAVRKTGGVTVQGQEMRARNDSAFGHILDALLSGSEKSLL